MLRAWRAFVTRSFSTSTRRTRSGLGCGIIGVLIAMWATGTFRAQDAPAGPRRRGPAPPVIAVTPELVARGRTVFTQQCASCHGNDGRGATATPGPRVPDLANADQVRVDDGQMARLIQTGHAGAAGQPTLRGGAIVALVAYVRTLADPKVRGIELQSLAQNELTTFVPVTARELENPPAADWLMARRTYDAWAYSPLDQVTRQNVGDLRLAWSKAIAPGGLYTTPLVRGGVLFLNNPGDLIQALDARNGDVIWEWQPLPRVTPNQPVVGDGRSNARGRTTRNLAILGDRLFHVTNDSHIVALDARTGRLLWDVEETPRGSGHMAGPLVAEGLVITGRSCAPPAGPEACYILANDAATGREVWRRHTIPRPGEPGDETWKGLPYEKRRHVGSWGLGSYDVVNRRVLWGTSVPAPSLEKLRGTPGGDVLFSNATLSLDVKTGAIAWYYQHLPRDNWDLDHVYERYVVDTVVAPDPSAVAWISPRARTGGKRRVVTGIPGKTGIVYTLDAATGEFLWARETLHQNVISSIEPESGRVRVNEELIVDPFVETTVCPSLGGGKNWPAGAYSPRTGLMYQPQQNMCNYLVGYTDKPTPADGYATNWFIIQDPKITMDPYPVGRIDAVSIETGRTAWLHQQRAGMLGTLLATAGDLVFGGDVNRRFFAFDATSGRKLWETVVSGPVSGSAISYAVDGRQYVAVAVGGGTASPERRALSLHPEIKPGEGNNALFVFALPSRP